MTDFEITSNKLMRAEAIMNGGKNMMQFKKVAVITLLFALAFAAAASFASAQVNQTGQVWTTNSVGGSPTVSFTTTDTVYIYWITGPASGPVIITVTGPYGYYDVVPALQQSQSPITIGPGLKSGTYNISVTSNGNSQTQTIQIAQGTFFVMPESIFGTISAVGAGFAAFGLVGFVKMRKQKKA